jgi:hypothetical protein
LITKLHASLDDVLWVINAHALVLAVPAARASRPALDRPPGTIRLALKIVKGA